MPRNLALDTLVKAFSDGDHACMSHVIEPGYRCDADVGHDPLAAHMTAPGAETALDAVVRLDTTS